MVLQQKQDLIYYYFVMVFTVFRYRNETLITCTTPSVNSSATGNIIVIFDNQTVQPDTAIEFTYRDNPTFTSIQPQRTILEYVNC